MTEQLSDLTEAKAYWEQCRERQENSREALIAALREARQHGATLQQLAEAMNVSRQYMHKLLR
jgi:DNA-binding phage protein